MDVTVGDEDGAGVHINRPPIYDGCKSGRDADVIWTQSVHLDVTWTKSVNLDVIWT